MRYKFLIAFIVLVVISLIDFAFYVDKELFFNHKFDVSETEYLSNLGDVQVVEATHNSIVFKDLKSKLKPKYTYNLKFKDGKSYNFTFHDWKTENQKTTLNYVVWLFVKPLQSKGKAVLKEIEIPRKEEGTQKVAFISEQLGCCLMNGKKMRFEWNKINSDINFVGQEKDVFGYGYYGGENITTSGLISKIERIENNDFVILWTGRNDGEKPTQDTVDAIGSMLKTLKQNNPNAKIVLMYPAPSPNEQYDIRINKVVKLLRQTKFDSEVLEIDLYKFIKDQNNWKDSFFFEDYGLTEEAYKTIVKHINGKIFK